MSAWEIWLLVAAGVAALVWASAASDRRARAKGHHPRGAGGNLEVRDIKRDLRVGRRIQWMNSDRRWMTTHNDGGPDHRAD